MKAAVYSILFACVSKWGFATSSETLFLPYDIFISTLNATTEQDLSLATNGVDSLSMLSLSSMIATCLESLSLTENESLKWEERETKDVNMAKVPARAIWMLSSLAGESLPNINRGIDKERERQILQSVRDALIGVDYFKMAEDRQAAKVLSGIHDKAVHERLLELARESDNSVVLAKLAEHDNADIRLAVANNRHASFSSLGKLMKDKDERVSSLANSAIRKNYIYAHHYDSNDKRDCIMDAIVMSKQPESLDRACAWLKSIPPDMKRDLLQWLASRLCDLRFSPAPGDEAPPPGHDLSLIGGKCAYILEKTLEEELAPVRRDTPIETLNEQRERLMKRINDKP